MMNAGRGSTGAEIVKIGGGESGIDHNQRFTATKRELTKQEHLEELAIKFKRFCDKNLPCEHVSIFALNGSVYANIYDDNEKSEKYSFYIPAHADDEEE